MYAQIVAHVDGGFVLLDSEGTDALEFTSEIKRLHFKPFDNADWDAFAGADEGSLICYTADAAFIMAPNRQCTCYDSDGAVVELEVVE